jgi:hypothetical protein
MAKLSDSPITAKDLLDFAVADSDFGFEMQVLRQLRAAGFTCSHSGTYRDPVTDKIRQFDIRASKGRVGALLQLAVECKKLRPNNPLLLSATARTSEEAFHDLVAWQPQQIAVSIGPVTALPVTNSGKWLARKLTKYLGWARRWNFSAMTRRRSKS